MISDGWFCRRPTIHAPTCAGLRSLARRASSSSRPRTAFHHGRPCTFFGEWPRNCFWSFLVFLVFSLVLYFIRRAGYYDERRTGPYSHMRRSGHTRSQARQGGKGVAKRASRGFFVVLARYIAAHMGHWARVNPFPQPRSQATRKHHFHMKNHMRI